MKKFLLLLLTFGLISCADTVKATVTGYIEVTETGDVYLIPVSDGSILDVVLLDEDTADEVRTFVGYLLEFEYELDKDGKMEFSYIRMIQG